MVYKDMTAPSENMRLSQYELNRMVREDNQALYNSQNETTIRENATLNREIEEYASSMQNYISEQAQTSKNRSEFLQHVKEAFLCQCILKLYEEATAAPMTDYDKAVAKNLVIGFVKEQGASNLIREFSSKNTLLAEMAKITNKYYERVLEEILPYDIDQRPIEVNPGEVKDYKLSTTIKDDFYSELDNIDCEDAGKLIKDRVADSIQQFLDSNAYAKMEYEDIINQAKEKINTLTSNTDMNDEDQAAHAEEIAQEQMNIARRTINEKKLSRPKNVFNLMVESLTRKVLTDDNYKTKFTNETGVDMEAVVDATTLIYTMLEMVNTTRMVNVDEQFIQGYIDNL